MPLYTFMNKDTDEVFTEMMSISQREEYLSQNPNITQQIVKVNMISGSGLKNDGGWNENLSRIAEAHPTSPFGRENRRRGIKEVKTEQVIKKHKARQNAKNK